MEFYLPSEVASLLRVTNQTVYRWCKRGVLEAVKVDRTVRIKKTSVDRLLEGES